MSAVWPNGSATIPRVTSEYGPRAPVVTPGGTTSSFHTGIDLVGWSEIRAARAGTIVYAGYSASNGNELKVDHGDGTFTRYFHLARFVRSGGSVAQGEVIGIMGMTGMATGVHLHFRVDYPLGTHHQPRDYMAQHLTPAQTEADKARVRRNATYLNGLGLASYTSGAARDGIPIDPPVTSKTVSKYYNLVQLWAKSRGMWNDSFGPPYLGHTMAADAALTAFLDAGGDAPPPPPPPPVKHTVTINYDDGVNEPKTLEVLDGTTVAQPSDPGKPGWAFAYWAVSGTDTAFDFTTRVTSDVNLTARYDRIMHVVTVDAGYPIPTTVEVADGDLAPRPTDPVKEGWTFTGWTLAGGEPYDFATPVTSDIVLAASYDLTPPPLHTVRLVYLDGSSSELRIVEGSAIGMVPDPGAGEEGYTFKGWYLDELGARREAFDFATPITGDLELFAEWTKEQPTGPGTPAKPTLSRGVLGILITLGGVIVAGVIAWLATLGG
jgi:uncharacterized repeat protein (TIGR02543 family)